MLLTKTHDHMLTPLIEAMPDKSCVLDHKLRIIAFNQSFSDMIFARHGFRPQKHDTMYDKVGKSDGAYWYPLLDKALQGMEHRELVSREMNGTRVDAEICLTPMRSEEQIMGVLVTIKDITRERAMQNSLLAFRELSSNLPNTDAYLCDENFNVLLAGGGEMKKYGADHTFFEGKNMLEMSRQLNLDAAVLNYFQQALQGIPGSIEYQFSDEYYLLEVYPVFDDSVVKNIIILSRNITEFKKITQKLESINQTKDSILGIVAHDLRNPVTAILGLSDLSKTQPTSLSQYLDLIDKSCRNALGIINDLLDISELGNDDYVLQTDFLELNGFLKEVIANNTFLAVDKNITIRFNTNKEDVFAYINPDKFTRVIGNLLSNAIKFSHKGSEISISTFVSGNKIRITVQDQGIGIPEKMRESIFEKFTKAGRKGTEGEKSMGLGMSIVKRIVQLHRGKIWIESEENIGTSVHIEVASAI